MVGRIWEVSIDPALAADFETFAGDVALPMVRGKMGCSAVYVLREAGTPGRYSWIILWLSRKAMLVAASSPDWEEVAQGFSRFGIPFELDHARAYESVATFRAGEKS